MTAKSLPVAADELIRRFDLPGVRAIVLTGSFARGDGGAYSDIDLLRFVDVAARDLPGGGSHLIDGTLVNVSNVAPDEPEDWLTKPEIAVDVVQGVRTAVPLLDRAHAFATIQARARLFVWDNVLQQRANVWASRQMVGWIEEAHKGLEGLRRNDTGRLLSAQFGLSWGLSNVVKVQRGVLLTGENTFWHELEAAVGYDSEWVQQRRVVFNVAAAALPAQVRAGLRLYALTAALIAGALQAADAPLIAATVQRITAALR
jgi:hypothetical protein